MLKNNFGFRLKFKSQSLLNRFIGKAGGYGIYDIRGPISKNGKHALVIYTAEAVSAKLSGKLDKFSKLNSHSGFRESLVLLDVLLEKGFCVDFLHLYNTPEIDWNKYELVIDAGQNLEKAPDVKGQKRVFYSTACHWKTFRENQLLRIESFQKRNGLLLKPDREITAGYSDDRADIITCFGGVYQQASFGTNAHKVKALNISCTHIPNDFEKKISKKNKFMWFGGYGPFHKGLDLVVEAFRELPDCELYVLGHLDEDIVFLRWLGEQFSSYKNLHFKGWVEPQSPEFRILASECDAVVFASSSEGGAGSILQCMQFGLIPIVNPCTSLPEEGSLFKIKGETPEAEIRSIQAVVNEFRVYSTEQLQKLSTEIQSAAREKYTLNAYRKSLEDLLSS